jgi:hypothetical protein
LQQLQRIHQNLVLCKAQQHETCAIKINSVFFSEWSSL